jgi:DinB superfamily
MNKAQIVHELLEKYQAFTDYLEPMNQSDFLFAFPHKWSAGQQLDHLIKSTKPLLITVRLPKFVLKLVFGKANRASKTYEGLVEKYQLKLQEGGRASAAFIPPPIDFEQKTALSKQLNQIMATLTKGIAGFTEKDLDTIILPHPLLGKITYREMMYFTICHVLHHQGLIKKALQERSLHL